MCSYQFRGTFSASAEQNKNSSDLERWFMSAHTDPFCNAGVHSGHLEKQQGESSRTSSSRMARLYRPFELTKASALSSSVRRWYSGIRALPHGPFSATHFRDDPWTLLTGSPPRYWGLTCFTTQANWFAIRGSCLHVNQLKAAIAR